MNYEDVRTRIAKYAPEWLPVFATGAKWSAFPDEGVCREIAERLSAVAKNYRKCGIQDAADEADAAALRLAAGFPSYKS